MNVQEARDACPKPGGPIQLVVGRVYTCILLANDSMFYIRHNSGKASLLPYDLASVMRESINWEPIREFQKPQGM
jgi:hypothetical protein